jgi:large subunit ribosomal protein L19e
MNHATKNTPRLTHSPFFPLQIQKAKAERQRDRALKEEMDAKRAKNKALRERRLERKEAKRDALVNEE